MAGYQGSSRGSRDSRWSAMCERRRQRAELCMQDEGGLGKFQRVSSGGIPSVLARSRRFLNVKESLWSMFEGLARLPCKMGVYCRCCLAQPGGSGELTEIIIFNNEFGARQSIFDRKSAVRRCLLISNQLTFKILRLERDTKLVEIFRFNM